ncbi:MAG: alpha-(1-_3)-arabinofuranosyltransferase family protein, partial [Gammaproteobacteria bacterium]|nr:alpha-(1->3)-arabinofuranosyltransferase family protein [Gammaproteobacteria bacterium]
MSGTDLYLPHDRLTFFNISLQTWDDRGLGSDNFRMLAIPLPYGAYLALTQVVGLNIVTTQKIWFYLMYVLTGISMYLLSTLIVSNNKSISNKNTVSLIASLYYMINPFFAMMLASFPFAWHMYALLPLKLYIFARGLLYKKQVGYIFITTFIWVLLSSSIYVNSKNILFDVLLISIFVLLYIFLIAEKQEKIIALKYTSKYFIILFLLSSYWLLPAFFGISENFKAVEESYNALGHGGRLTTFQLNSANSIFDAFRQWGLWSAYESYKGEPYYYWSIFYKSSTAIVVSLFVILIALIPIFSKKLNKYLLIFYIVWCLSIVGMAGATFSQSQQIYEIINIQLVKYLPFFVDLFSVPYLFFGMYNSIALSLLFAIGLYISVKYLTKRHVKFEYVLYMLSVLVLLVYSMPIINGDVFRKDSTVMKGSRYEVPEYYHNAANYYNSQNLLSRTFPLPYSSQVYMSNNWDKGYTGFGIYHLLNKNVVYGVLDISTLTSKSINN